MEKMSTREEMVANIRVEDVNNWRMTVRSREGSGSRGSSSQGGSGDRIDDVIQISFRRKTEKLTTRAKSAYRRIWRKRIRACIVFLFCLIVDELVLPN